MALQLLQTQLFSRWRVRDNFCVADSVVCSAIHQDFLGIARIKSILSLLRWLQVDPSESLSIESFFSHVIRKALTLSLLIKGDSHWQALEAAEESDKLINFFATSASFVYTFECSGFPLTKLNFKHKTCITDALALQVNSSTTS